MKVFLKIFKLFILEPKLKKNSTKVSWAAKVSSTVFQPKDIELCPRAHQWKMSALILKLSQPIKVVKSLQFTQYAINKKISIFSDKCSSRRSQPEALLPGLGYTQRQLFWVSAANVWCAKYRPKALKLRVMTGVHAPDMFRVRGPFSNMKEFARDFNCPLGSSMNPREKCQVW